MNQEITYWVALALTPKMWTSRKNQIIAHSISQGKNIIDFFSSDDYLAMELSQQERDVLLQTKLELANHSFLAEELLNQGYDIIPITSKEYSPTLKINLKYNSPVVLFTKGNKQLLQNESIAIVGSRNANNTSLQFTDTIAKKATAEYKTVISGFANGVDKQALDSAIAYNGQSIIVLPQGITTFSSGIKKYYKQIINGDVLVLSTFHPRAPWSVDLAMARNAIIYGLATEIYAAQSDDKGGTWSGVTDGLKRGRKIYIRVPEDNEQCANNKLITMGGIPVDINGTPQQKTEEPNLNIITNNGNIDERIFALLSQKAYNCKQIIEALSLSNMTPQGLGKILSKIDGITKEKKGNAFVYSYKTPPRQLSISLE